MGAATTALGIRIVGKLLAMTVPLALPSVLSRVASVGRLLVAVSSGGLRSSNCSVPEGKSNLRSFH